MASVINMQALKIMSERLPETEADMMNIPHVTRANFDKFGQRFLEVTLKYTAEKLCKFVYVILFKKKRFMLWRISVIL